MVQNDGMGPAEIRLYDTMTRTKRPLETVEPGRVRLYCCGPTVYDTAHVGNLRTYVMEDLVRRTLEASGYEVRHVMNVTDVGHLESDADAGRDRMEIAAARERRSPWEIARAYEALFFEDCERLSILRPHVVSRATEHVPQMIALVERILARGFAYVVDGNVYFDVARFPGYGRLAGAGAPGGESVARVEADARKRDPRDFVLWFSQSKYPNQVMRWDSPWGVGFPGWHVECSAMAMAHLGDRVDLHMGGVDHVPVHHTNEIAQSEAVLGRPWVGHWAHTQFLTLDRAKMSKSAGGFLRVSDLGERGFAPVHYRYFCLGAHYRSTAPFSWEALESARAAFENLKNKVVRWRLESPPSARPRPGAGAAYRDRFFAAARDDVNVPVALSALWEAASDASLQPVEKRALALDVDRVLGLGLASLRRPDVSPEVSRRIEEREDARRRSDFARADAVRDALRAEGIEVRDTPDGPDWYSR